MTPRSFLALAGGAAACVIAATAAIGLDGTSPALAERGERLFPDLAARAGDIARIEMRDGDMTMTVEARDGRFVDARSGYPVDTATLRALVTSLGSLEIAERKTDDPARHGQLDLAGWDAETGAGAEITLIDSDGDTIAAIVAGRRDVTLGGASGGQFVRRGGEAQAWLVSGRVEAPTRRRGWFDATLHQSDPADITRVTLTPADAAPISLERQDGRLSMTTPPPPGRVADDARIGRLARVIAGLDFDDVLPDSGEAPTGARLDAETATGLRLALVEVATPQDADGTWIRIDVSAAEPQAAEAAGDLADRVNGNLFRLSSWDAAPFDWSVEDLTAALDS